MAKTYEKLKIIEILREIPLVRNACKKAGVSPDTFYRWVKDNPEFREAVEKAKALGRESLNDLGESVIVKKMGQGDLGATKFYLINNHERYRSSSGMAGETRLQRELQKSCEETEKVLKQLEKVKKVEIQTANRIKWTPEEIKSFKEEADRGFRAAASKTFEIDQKLYPNLCPGQKTKPSSESKTESDDIHHSG